LLRASERRKDGKKKRVFENMRNRAGVKGGWKE